MEEVKLKKSSFQKVVIVFNIIAIILMIVIIAKVGIVEECTNNSYGISTNMELFQFNSKFTPYEGIRTGSQIKQLVETVNASNIENYGTEIVVSINGRTNENQYTCNVSMAKRYKVEFEYEYGAVSNINIYKIYESTEFAEIAGTMQEYNINKADNKNDKEDSKKDKIKYNIDWGRVFVMMILYSPVFILYLVVVIFNEFDKNRVLKKYSGEEYQKQLDKVNTNKIISIFIISTIVLTLNFIYFYVFNNVYEQETVRKPIIYIYPEEETEVTVE